MERGSEPTYLVDYARCIFHKLRYRFGPKGRKTDPLFHYQQASALLYGRHQRPGVKGI
jgi:hypothetical protein